VTDAQPAPMSTPAEPMSTPAEPMSTLAEPMHAQRHRAESFGAQAAEYDIVRPGYPPALFDDLVAGGRRTALDIGCGTGRAAVPLRDRGLQVLGVEIDAEMAAVARGHGLSVEVGAFEQWDPAGRSFDLVVAGQAWHWIDPALGLPQAARLLNPDGLFAVFWNSATLDAPTQAYLDAVYAEHALQLQAGNTGRRGSPPYLDAVRDSGQFSSVEVREYPWRDRYSTDRWIRLVQTHSDHAVLDPAPRAALIEAVAAAIDAHGGQIEAAYSTYTVLARRNMAG
jgi:SAM-dependent methyltransferase